MTDTYRSSWEKFGDFIAHVGGWAGTLGAGSLFWQLFGFEDWSLFGWSFETAASIAIIGFSLEMTGKKCKHEA